jgi:flagellar hook assembly protein FlgD
MLPNYPNPFNPITNIKFELPQETYVNLAVMNLLGRGVKTLINGEMISGGFHQIMWNGLSNSGAPVPSGVYLILFNTKNYKKYYKALLIK